MGDLPSRPAWTRAQRIFVWVALVAGLGIIGLGIRCCIPGPVADMGGVVSNMISSILGIALLIIGCVIVLAVIVVMSKKPPIRHD